MLMSEQQKLQKEEEDMQGVSTISGVAVPSSVTKIEEQPQKESRESKIQVEDLNFYYGRVQALRGISLAIPEKQVTAFIGPSGCGKSTLLRTFNGMDVVSLRRRVGMVFQKSNPFPRSIFDNVAYGLKINRMTESKSELEVRVEASLRASALWDEVKDRLKESALGLSGGQQQRLCIARALAVEPEVILMDEPCSALDPIATQKIEELIVDLKSKYTIVIVTHNMQQAARVSDRTAFFWLGEMIEFNTTEKIFTKPDNRMTEDYITGRFG